MKNNIVTTYLGKIHTKFNLHTIMLIAYKKLIPHAFKFNN